MLGARAAGCSPASDAAGVSYPALDLPASLHSGSSCSPRRRGQSRRCTRATCTPCSRLGGEKRGRALAATRHLPCSGVGRTAASGSTAADNGDGGLYLGLGWTGHGYHRLDRGRQRRRCPLPLPGAGRAAAPDLTTAGDGSVSPEWVGGEGEKNVGMKEIRGGLQVGPRPPQQVNHRLGLVFATSARTDGSHLSVLLLVMAQV